MEKVFRDEREKRLTLLKKEQDEMEKQGGGGRYNQGRGGGMRNPADVNF